jgi:hypothetical protein
MGKAMARLSGNEKLVLITVREAQGDSNNFVRDHRVAEIAKMPITDVRDSIEILEGEDLLEVARAEGSFVVTITARGRQRLGRMAWQPAAKAT